MNYCEKCGNKIEPGAQFCVSCGNKIYNDDNKIKNTNDITPEDNKKANTLGIISLILFFCGPFISFIIEYISAFDNGYITTALSSISGLSGIVAIVLMIIIRVKYPKNVLGKVIMWIYIGLIIFSVVIILLFIGVIISFISGLL